MPKVRFFQRGSNTSERDFWCLGWCFQVKKQSQIFSPKTSATLFIHRVATSHIPKINPVFCTTDRSMGKQ